MYLSYIRSFKDRNHFKSSAITYCRTECKHTHNTDTQITYNANYLFIRTKKDKMTKHKIQ